MLPEPAMRPKQDMPPFPSVSKTSLGAFEDCERKWALNYQWWKVPQAIKGDIMLERKLMPFTALVGQVVDDTITAALRCFHTKGYWPKKPLAKASEELFEQYLETTRKWIQFRKHRQDPDDPRRQPIDRVYYGEPILSSEKAELLERIAGCLDSWEAAGIKEWVSGFEPETWRVPESEFTPWFDWEGVPVWAKYDFAIVTPGKTYIVDWKTGKPEKRAVDAAQDQLHTYAAFAMRKWNVPRDEIVLRAVWLAAGPERCIDDRTVEVDVLARLYRHFKEFHADLINRMKAVGRNGENLFESFPKSGYPNRCRWCHFHSCEGYVENERRWKEGRSREE